MKTTKLGKTQLKVSELCFGTLPMGPLQADMALADGVELIKAAMQEGVNFIDTAESYCNYKYVKQAIKEMENKVIIATKSTAKNYFDMEKSVYQALADIEVDYIDIFHIHAPRDIDPLAERKGALRCLTDFKKKGLINYLGVSTHSIEAVQRVSNCKSIDIIFPLVNKSGMGIIDGSIEKMLTAIKQAHQLGKGIYAMKALAGGNLIHKLEEALNFVREKPFIDSVAVGMLNKEELKLNLMIFNDQKIPSGLIKKAIRAKKLLVRHELCRKCELCVKACPNHALNLTNGKITVSKEKCILCAYCRPHCPQFALRM